MEISLKDRCVVITGGYTALGMAIARGFAESGARVGLIARTREKLDEAAQSLRAMGVRAVSLPADITDEGQVIAAFDRAQSELGRIDVLVNSTGIPGTLTPVKDLELAEWNRILAVNLTGAMLCCREAVRRMLPQSGGAIVNIGSSAGKRAGANLAPYSAAKAGMISLTQALAQEVGKFNIRVNCIALGVTQGPRTDSQIQRRSKATGMSLQEVHAMYVRGSAMGRLVTQRELAALAVFLASDLSSGMTGQAINLTAGAYLG